MSKPEPWALLSVAVQQADITQCPQMLGELERFKASLWLRMTIRNQAAVTPQQDRLLTAKEVAERLNVTEAFVYRNARSYPFMVRQGRYIRFSNSGLDQHIKRLQGKG
jgi:predicted DNA-binding transcriptional regulator AlpA